MTDEHEAVQSKLTTPDENRVHETYVNALHHDNATIPIDAWRVGVVNIKMYGIDGVTDTNFESLGPPDELFTAFRDTRSDLEDDGMDKQAAHNAAWDAVNFEGRYWSYLADGWENNTAVRDACNTILAELDTRPVGIVCYEGTEKHCHRHVLKSFLDEKAASAHESNPTNSHDNSESTKQ